MCRRTKVAGAPEKEIRELTVFGLQIGQAFQIQDDIIGIFEEEDVIGKSILSDLEEGKKTLLMVHANRTLTGKKKKEFLRIFNKPKKALKDLEAVETTGAEIRELEARVEGARGELEEAGRALASVIDETAQLVTDRRAEEAEVLKALPLEVVDRYRLIRGRRGGLAVVEARDEACTACFMRIPPQTYIEVMRRSKVIQCPNCHRILIPPRPVEGGEEVPAE